MPARRLWSWRRGGVLMCAVLAVMVVILAPAGVQALDVPPKPTDIPVVDQTGTLNDEQKQALAKRIADERAATGNQIAILMIKSLEGESLEEYSLEVARGWGVGQKERNSGVLLLVAKDDRKLRIEVGYGLEGALPDIRAAQIIRDRIAPQFRQGKYYEGLNEGLSGIITAIHGEADPNLKSEGETKDEPWWMDWLGQFFWAIFIVPVWLGAILARTKSWWAGGVIGGVIGLIIAFFVGFIFAGLIVIAVMAVIGLLFDWFVSRNFRTHARKGESPSWWAGGPWIGGSGGSGSGGGFGGGSFGGGGSSGDW